MRCPRCRTESPAGGYCPGCGRRLFGWLGDPFGSTEPFRASEITAPGPRPLGPAVSTGKLMAGVVAIALAVIISPWWAAGLLILVLAVSKRWPGVGWWPWSLVLGGTLLLAVLGQQAISRA
jgi:hypothetical protein